MERKLQVEAIVHGSVIDHIPAGQGIKILKFFQLAETQERITIGLNLPSAKQGRKDLIKIENTLISDEQANQLALFAPGATINLIHDQHVFKKFEVQLPEEMIGVLSCPNSNCITHSEPVHTRFKVRQQQQSIKLNCHYCEKTFSTELFKELSN